MVRDEQPGRRLLKSYVWHGDDCFFVSTIERDSSAAVSPPLRYAETLVWEFDWGPQLKGAMIGMEGNGPAFKQHMTVCKNLFERGVVESEQ